MQAAFGEFYRIEQLIISTTNSSSSRHRTPSGLPSIVTPANIKLLFAMQARVDALTAKSGQKTSLADICFQPLGGACAIESVLQYWQMSETVYEQGLPGQVHASSTCFVEKPAWGYPLRGLDSIMKSHAVTSAFDGALEKLLHW